MRLNGRDVWYLDVYSWRGRSIGATHWYYDLRNTVGQSDKYTSGFGYDDDESTPKYDTEAEATTAGMLKWLEMTKGADTLVIASEAAVRRGLSVDPTWEELS